MVNQLGLQLKKYLLIFVIFIFIQFNQSLFAQDRSFIATSVAVFDVIQQHEPSIEGRLEYRLNKLNWKLDPFIGVMGNSDEAKYIYFGTYSEFVFFNKLVLSPSSALGFYFRGKSKDLSFILEFRSQFEVSYRFSNSMKLGLSLTHISNAGIKPPNIGVESLALTLIFPIH
jgi:lipid A 3-O-deacylase